MLALRAYASSDDENNSDNSDDGAGETKTQETQETNSETAAAAADFSKPINPAYSVQKQLQICAAPIVLPTVNTF